MTEYNFFQLIKAVASIIFVYYAILSLKCTGKTNKIN